MLLCIIAAEVLAISINTDKRIKGIQTGDYEIKIVNFANDTTIFLRDFKFKLPHQNTGIYLINFDIRYKAKNLIFELAFLVIKIKKYLDVSYMQLFDYLHIHTITYIIYLNK